MRSYPEPDVEPRSAWLVPSAPDVGPASFIVQQQRMGDESADYLLCSVIEWILVRQ